MDPQRLTDLVRAVAEIYRAAEIEILDLVTRQLRADLRAPDVTPRRSALRALRVACAQVLTRLEADGSAALREAVAAAYRRGGAAVLAELTEDAAARLAARQATSVVRRSFAVSSLAAALIADVAARHSAVLRQVLDVYRVVVARAVAGSVAGGLTRRQAAQSAYARLVARGVVSFLDRRGRRWRLSSYVEMATRTVTARAAVQGQTDRQARLGLPFVMVSNEAQECALCRRWEGRVLRLDDGPTGSVLTTHAVTDAPIMIDVAGTLERARAAGFQHPNCRHSVRAYLPGVTRLPQRPTADPQGDVARQRQRAIERHIRAWKERERAALEPGAANAARAKVRAWQAEMRAHLQEYPDLKRLAYREQIGAGNIAR